MPTCVETFCDSRGINKVTCTQTADNMRIQITDFYDNLQKKIKCA